MIYFNESKRLSNKARQISSSPTLRFRFTPRVVPSLCVISHVLLLDFPHPQLQSISSTALNRLNLSPVKRSTLLRRTFRSTTALVTIAVGEHAHVVPDRAAEGAMPSGADVVAVAGRGLDRELVGVAAGVGEDLDVGYGDGG